MIDETSSEDHARRRLAIERIAVAIDCIRKARFEMQRILERRTSLIAFEGGGEYPMHLTAKPGRAVRQGNCL
jgi:hypothetical protein